MEKEVQNEAVLRLGFGPVLVCVLLFVMVINSLVQLLWVVQAQTTMRVHFAVIGGPFLITGALRTFSLAVALYLIAYERRPRSVYVTIAALFFAWPISEILAQSLSSLLAFHKFKLKFYPVSFLTDLPIIVLTTAYLLLSRKTNEIYGLRTRAIVIIQAPRIWARLRGRDNFDSESILETR
ncbi:MAG TPA: hypothetical protein VFW19_05055 [Allosphingosinicella sp.]|nr:hypothetical protein [Allosphingosinicella sp.]